MFLNFSSFASNQDLLFKCLCVFPYSFSLNLPVSDFFPSTSLLLLCCPRSRAFALLLVRGFSGTRSHSIVVKLGWKHTRAVALRWVLIRTIYGRAIRRILLDWNTRCQSVNSLIKTARGPGRFRNRRVRWFVFLRYKLRRRRVKLWRPASAFDVVLPHGLTTSLVWPKSVTGLGILFTTQQ